MTNFSIIGSGNMAKGIAHTVRSGGASVQIIARTVANAEIEADSVDAFGTALTGDIVVLALPHPAIDEVLASYGDQLAGKIVVDITNPIDFATFDSLVVPAGTSYAALLAEKLPNSTVIKAFNTNFAAHLAAGTVGDNVTTVLIAGDDADAKATLSAAITAGGLAAVDAGALTRAEALEQLGFLQLTLAVSEQISWTSGFALVK